MIAERFRSLLFVPASRVDMLARAHERAADAIILDLEDGVAEADRPAARASLACSLEGLRAKGIPALVRINPLGSGGELDIAAIPDSLSPPLLLPKVTDPIQILAIEECWVTAGKELANLQLLPMIESPKGMFQAELIATATVRVSALVFGSEDFAAEAGLSTDVEAMLMPAQWVALAAAAAGKAAYGLPGSLGNYQDGELFEATLRRAKTIGFAGSLCIHPVQVTLANDVFQPGEEETKWAEAVVSQVADSGGISGGVSGGELGMVDAPVLARARAILAQSKMKTEES
ncbi:MAG: CoA ester lyase [Pseudomonadales bacterium]